MPCDKQVAEQYEENREIYFLPSALSCLWGSWVMTGEAADLGEGIQKGLKETLPRPLLP